MKPDAYRGFRLAIVGGCQVVGLRRWAYLMLPGAEVNVWHVNAGPHAAPAIIAPQLPGHDLIIGQLGDEAEFGVLGISALRGSYARVVHLPMFTLTGLHPDCFSQRLQHGPPWHLLGPLDINVSVIAVAAYHLGIPAGRVSRLLNALVFAELGYFAVFEDARQAAEAIFAESGYDLAGMIQAWLRDGAFMHSINHPHIRVLGSLARMALEKAGLEVSDISGCPTPQDDLGLSVRWPLYPALARRLGVAGSTDFVRAIGETPAGEMRALPVDAFVVELYWQLQAATGSGLTPDPRVEHTIEVLRRLYGRNPAFIA